jgi:hypothetical protein
MRWVHGWVPPMARLVCWELSVRRVAGPLGPVRVWVECTHHVGRTHAENPATKASNSPKRVTSLATQMRAAETASNVV